jgi:hypothetical protein
MSVVFGFSICTATANTSTVGNDNFLLGFLFGEEWWWGVILIRRLICE